MRQPVRFDRRTLVGLVLASLPTTALANATRDVGGTSARSERWVSDAPDDRGQLPGPYSPAYGARPVSILTQLHDHTTGSDGAKTPAGAVDFYRGAGYGALAITDHDVITEQPAGIPVPLVGCEASPLTGHVGGLNSAYRRGKVSDTQSVIDGITASGGCAILNHPNWQIGYSHAQLAKLAGYQAIEIHNAACVGLTPGYRGFAVEKWDAALSNVRRDIWGIATDDYHRTEYWCGHDVGRTVVFSRSASTADVLDSISRGCFVADASNLGVTPGYPSISETGVSVECPGAVAIRFVGDGGALLAETAGPSARYAFVGTERYVRIEAVGDYAEPFDRELDWSNRWGQVVAGSGIGWQVSDGVLQQKSDTADRKFAWLKRHVHGDLDLTVDCRVDHSPGDGCRPGAGVGFVATTFGYGYAIVPDVVDHTFGLVRYDRDVPTTLQRASGFTVQPGQWYTIRVSRTHANSRIQARWWLRGEPEPSDWPIDTFDANYQEGAVYLRSTFAASFDDLYVRGYKTYYQPIPVGMPS